MFAPLGPVPAMEAFVLSMLVVGLAEVGDKSLFFAILLVVRHQRPWPVFWGLIAGISINLAIAAWLGAWLAVWVDGKDWLPWVLGVAFIAMGLWALLPESPGGARPVSRGGLFTTAATGFFLLEMADKTQLTTLALAARFETFLPVLTGAVVGVVAVNAPAIWLGHRFAGHLPLGALRVTAAVLFGVLGAWIIGDAVL